MLKVFISLFIIVVTVSGQCVDKQNNAVDVADKSNAAYNAEFQNAVGATYDSNGNPSCYKGHPNLKLPGDLKLISGKLVVKESMNLVGNSQIYLTLKKDSFLIGTVCENGKSKNPLIPDKDCKFDFCTEASPLCTALGTPGTHTLGEIEGDLGINGTIPLPSLSSAIMGILKGKWQATLDIHSNGKIVASLIVPSNEKYIDVQE